MGQVVDWVVVGRFGRVHGIKGYISVHSFTEPRDKLMEYCNWHANIRGQWVPLQILDKECQERALLVLVEGYPTRDKAAELTNIEIGINREQLPDLPAGEYYCHQLIGMTVINKQNETLGKVVDLLPTGANDVLVIQGEKRVLIPYLPGRYVLDVDTSQGIIRVDWELDFLL